MIFSFNYAIVPQTVRYKTQTAEYLILMPNPTLKLVNLPDKKPWQEELSNLITDPGELLALLGLDEKQLPLSLAGMNQFPLKVPRPFAEKMQKGNWQDPLLLQVWPALAEEKEEVLYVKDPLEEAKSNPIAGLLHKYAGRVLLTAAPHCAIHCRYCFRRHFDYKENSPKRSLWQKCFDYIAADSSIEEVILSGGDPLALADKQLGWLLDNIEAIEHVTTIRIHTRLPVVIPQRITEKFVHILKSRRTRIVVVIHSNHRNELDDEFKQAIARLAAIGCTLLNQTVILKGVNDSADRLIELNKTLFSMAVLPYYLHLPDEVKGTAHFDLPTADALAIVRQMRACLPGYLVPTLVKEVAGEVSKIPFY